MIENFPTGGKIVTVPMPLARFETLIATYGAAPERWPHAERAAAESLVERSAEARDVMANAAILDRLLESDAAPAPSDDLVRNLERRFVEANQTAPVIRPTWRMPSLRWVFRPGIAVAAFAAIAVVALAMNRWALDPVATESGPVLVRALPPIEIGADGFIDEDGPLEPEIALIDPSIVIGSLNDDDHLSGRSSMYS